MGGEEEKGGKILHIQLVSKHSMINDPYPSIHPHLARAEDEKEGSFFSFLFGGVASESKKLKVKIEIEGFSLKCNFLINLHVRLSERLGRDINTWSYQR